MMFNDAAHAIPRSAAHILCELKGSVFVTNSVLSDALSRLPVIIYMFVNVHKRV